MTFGTFTSLLTTEWASHIHRKCHCSLQLVIEYDISAPHFGRFSYFSGMADSTSSSSGSERHGSPLAARTGPKCSRTFVWLRELPKAIPRGRPWDELNREGRVKEIEFGKKFTERHMRDKIKENFPELAEADFTR